MGGAIGGIASAVVGGIASGRASKAQSRASGSAAQASLERFFQTREDLEPYRELGELGVERLRKLIEDPQAALETSPGYQFRLAEGQKAIERAAASRGGLVSGRALKELQRFGQGTASNEFANQFSRLQSLASLGGTAATQTGQFGQQAQQQANLANIGAANARAAGIQGIGSSIGSGIASFVAPTIRGQDAQGNTQFSSLASNLYGLLRD